MNHNSRKIYFFLIMNNIKKNLRTLNFFIAIISLV